MLLAKEKLQHINSITHEGKVIIVATDADGKIWYTVKQDGFEDSYLNQQPENRTGWEGWKQLELPNEKEDQSVVDKEKEELTYQNNNTTYLLKSLYKTDDKSAIAPVQLVSGLGHLYIFRQSKSNTLLVDRFVLDGLTNTLTRKLEVRFKRSKQKHTPSKNQKKGSNGLIDVDSLDYRDINGNNFYEPTTELSLVKNLANGWFSVVLLPTSEQDKYRWHIFAYNSGNQKVELTTLRASDEGLFDIKDYTILDPEPRTIPGIIKRSLNLGSITVAKGLTATKYDLQRERKTDDGMQLMRESVHVMLAVGTTSGEAAAISFAVAADGTLSEIKDTPDSTTIRRSMTRQVLLPLNTLDEIKAIGTTNPPLNGSITGFGRGEEDKVIITSNQSTGLDATKITEVKITKNQDYNRLYSSVTKIDENTFEITPASPNGGNWEVVPKEETGLIFNGMVTAYEITTSGKLKVESLNHGLENGDSVQIVDTKDYNGTYTVTKVNDKTFSLDGVKWQAGTTISAKLQTQKRRGVVFDGGKDYVEVPYNSQLNPNQFTISCWVKVTGGQEKYRSPLTSREAGDNKSSQGYLIYAGDNNKWQVWVGNGGATWGVVTGSNVTLNVWTHICATYDGSKLTLYIDGTKSGDISTEYKVLNSTKPLRIGAGNTEGSAGSHFHGQISDVCIWNKARTVDEIKNNMYLQLTGQEVGLVGYWRLDAIVEGKERKVIDFSVNGNDGIVKGGAYVSSVTLNRNLAGTSTPAIKYENEDLFAVTERATYTEEFEFKTDNNVSPNNADGSNGKIFAITYKGKKNRRSQDWITITAEETQFTNLDNNWWKASCRFTVPDGVSVMRSFGIVDVKGNWSNLEIRKHQIQLISDSITEKIYTDDLTNITTLADKQVELQGNLKNLGINESREGVLLKKKRELQAQIDLLNLPQEEATKIKEQEVNAQRNIFNSATANKKYWDAERTRGTLSITLYIHTCFNGKSLQRGLGRHVIGAIAGWNDIVSSVKVPTGLRVTLYKHGDFSGDSVTSSNDMQYLPTGMNNETSSIIVETINGNTDLVYIQNQLSHWQNKEQQENAKLTELEKQLTLLKADINVRKEQLKNLEERLDQVKKQLSQIQTELNNANNTFITGVKNNKQTPQTMPLLNTDSRGLVTKGALLGFVRPASRLSAIETCEGNVQLSYFDDQGRMRQTNFDATADSTNPTIEQWVPDSLRTCLNFNKDNSVVDNSVVDNSVVNLNSPINLGEEWTIEAWFSYPLPETSSSLNTLIHSDIGSIRIRNQKYIEADFGNNFAISRYSLENLSIGWHHLAVVGRITDKKATQTCTFYLDGKEIDKTALSSASLIFKNDGDYLVGGDKVNLADKSFTIEFWAKRSNNSTNNQFLITQGTTQLSNGLHIGFRDSTTFSFAFWSNDLNAKVSQDFNWHHWACVYDANSKKQMIYCDGKRLAERSAVNYYKGAGNLRVGKAEWGSSFTQFKGEITELRIWTKPLTQNEIQDNMFEKLMNPDKITDLVAYWQFGLKDNKAEAIDISSKKAKGTLYGNPTVEIVSASMVISRIGNATGGNQRAGKLAEIRLWGVALSQEEIEVNSKTLLTGNEPGLLAYYPFNEATGNQVRNQTGNSKNNNNGNIQGASWWGCAAPIGNLGHQVMQFNGVDSYVEVPYNQQLNPNQFTISCWVKVTGGEKTYRSPLTSRDTGDNKSSQGYLIYAGDNNKWQVWVGNGGATWSSVTGSDVTLNVWTHICATYDGSKLTLYINGTKSGDISTEYKVLKSTKPLRIGAGNTEGSAGSYFHGQIREVCIWNKARTEAVIQADMNKRLTGKESGLVAYYPLNEIKIEGLTNKVLDLAQNNHGTVIKAIIVPDQNLPIAGNALISCEYSTVSKDKSAMMRRFFAAPTPGGVNLLPDKRIEELQLKWIGNGQFAPTLLGYIEGAPPIPSENLTIEDNYNGATSVELDVSEDVVFNWTRSQDAGLGRNYDLYYGSDVDQSIVTAPLGVGQQIKTTGVRAGFKGNLDFSYQFQNESSITSSSSLSMTDALQLSGTQEEEANFPHLGKRFIPKNVGYALVISALTDVFVTRLQRSGKMIGYQVLPVENIPPDVNTITFLINPAYTMSGSLDGMTGSSATSQRFFKHVPEMRSQFGSLYPASYYRLQEAYNLKQQIDQQDKNREAYFAQFNSRLLDEASLGREINKGDAPSVIVINRVEDKPDANQTPEQIQAADKERQEKLKEELQEALKQQSEAVKKKQAEIDQKIADEEKKSHATASFAGWQKKMEDIQIRAGKRNIVNTYVWDADGGLHAEAQSFANTAEHSIGGSFSLNAALGAEGNFTVFGLGAELTAQATVNLTQTMRKTETRSKGIQLNVDLSGVESRGVTDYNDYPILPGEKVSRYRFMSFYLEGSTNNFHDFFNYVVDPEWLASNGEEARALRQARVKANKAWRVLHRVTYVERPALMGFGRDVRQLPPAELSTDLGQLQAKVDRLEQQNAEMQRKLDEILKKLPN